MTNARGVDRAKGPTFCFLFWKETFPDALRWPTYRKHLLGRAETGTIWAGDAGLLVRRWSWGVDHRTATVYTSSLEEVLPGVSIFGRLTCSPLALGPCKESEAVAGLGRARRRDEMALAFEFGDRMTGLVQRKACSRLYSTGVLADWVR